MRVTVVGLGPGAGRDLTGRAREALEQAELIIGYTAYIELIREEFSHKEMRSTGMRKEVDRCRAAVEEAVAGKDVAMVCSGDSGIYGMAALVYEVAQEYPPIEIEVVPGITAACGGAAVLGAPLTPRLRGGIPVGPPYAVGKNRAAAHLCGPGGFCALPLQSGEPQPARTI